MTPIGIDDLACYVPALYLDLRVLADERQLSYEKLALGLGLLQMAVPDVGEDAATMAAEAAAELMERNGLAPSQIGRLYLGTESALDQSKPTATYALGMLEQRYSAKYGPDCFRHCDTLDMTFACIAGVDALHNALDWVAANPGQIAIVVASDIAKYEAGSTGEYTQGAGAVAILVKHNPRLMVIRRVFGVAVKSVHDFFKPRRGVYTDTPVFDGQFSNQCYQERMHEALADFRKRCEKTGVWDPGAWPALTDRWARIIFHLPYAYHARRIFVEAFIAERKAKGTWIGEARRYRFTEPELAESKEYRQFLKAVSESKLYNKWVADKIEGGQWASQRTGNLYTASIFLALIGAFEEAYQGGTPLKGKRFGFIGYGSGSKAKVFEGIVQAGWESVASQFRLNEKLDNRRPITYEEYYELHAGARSAPVEPLQNRWRLVEIGTEGVLSGARFYGMK